MIAIRAERGQYNSIERVVAERRVTLARLFKAGIKENTNRLRRRATIEVWFIRSRDDDNCMNRSRP